jgi:glycosyltransferase involved in cell wall biosynthesis
MPDVLFAHDPAVAERLLSLRLPGQQVWLMVHSPMPIALYLAWAFGVPEWEWTAIASLPDTRQWIDWELDLWSRVDRLVAPCPEAIVELARVDARFGVPRDIGYVLTGASGPARAFASDTREALRRRWKLPANEPIGLFLGSAQPYRGLDALLAAVDALPDSTPGRVAIAGPSRDAAPRHRRLLWLGQVREVSDLLQAVDFVVNVNRFSLFDLSMIEALEAGRPLLMHGIGGNLRFATLGAGCRLLSDLHPSTIARGLGELFTMDSAEREALGRQSRALYESELTPDHLWSRHAALYDNAAASHYLQQAT